MSKLTTALGLSAGLALGGYGFYVGELDGSKPLSAGQVALVRGEYLDAIYFSPHKFLGGPGTCGVLIFNEKIYRRDLPPTCT